MRQPREPTTRQEIDKEIQRLADEIKDIQDDYGTYIEEAWEGTEGICKRDFYAEITARRQKIKALDDIKESMQRPWEKTRPTHERSLCAFGVV